MKRILILVSFLGLFGSSAIAQNFFVESQDQNQKAYLSAGVTGGLTRAELSSSLSSYEDFGIRQGVSFGGFLNIRFKNRNLRSTPETGLLAFQPEVRFTMAGGNSSESNLGLNYLMVPAMFQYYPSTRLFLEAGPAFGLNVSHTPDVIVASSTEYNLADLTANDVAFALGAGVRLDSGLGLSARYYVGTSDLASNMPFKNRWLEIGISYAWPLKSTKTNQFFDR